MRSHRALALTSNQLAREERRGVTPIKHIVTLATCALVASILSVGSANAQAKKLTPTEAACACLQKVSIEYKGKPYHLREYDPSTNKGHYRVYRSDDPDMVIAGGISLRAGLIDKGSPWAAKEADIKKCMGKIPNLKHVNRSDK